MGWVQYCVGPVLWPLTQGAFWRMVSCGQRREGDWSVLAAAASANVLLGEKRASAHTPSFLRCCCDGAYAKHGGTAL